MEDGVIIGSGGLSVSFCMAVALSRLMRSMLTKRRTPPRRVLWRLSF